ncbi:unnamed protein product [Dovyalis caffra]|uniref:Uncharacterized protein n=1 Tax=Dovyalis caffra TaxID=77055 RepID=A0AAV1RS99_9ROSI|nr:unnamed protein product [Dovyalis caffra]
MTHTDNMDGDDSEVEEVHTSNKFNMLTTMNKDIIIGSEIMHECMLERHGLWNDLIHLSAQVQESGLIGGDFNVISNVSEKLRGMERKVSDANNMGLSCFYTDEEI